MTLAVRSLCGGRAGKYLFAAATAAAWAILTLAEARSVDGRRSGVAGYCSAGSALPAAGVRVLVIAADSHKPDVQSKLLGVDAFTAVDVFDAASSTPALSGLQDYAAVLVWNTNSSFASAAGLGDVLAQYFDGGGGVVVASWANCNSYLRGRFGAVANGYMLINGTAACESPADSLGAVLEAQSPLMTGVTALSAQKAYRSTGAVINGGQVVAQWASNGRPLVVRGTRANRPLVALNVYPPSSSGYRTFWTGDGAELLRNALLYSACAPCTAGTFTAAGSPV